VPETGCRDPLLKRVEAPPNALSVTAARRATGLFFGSGHWHCSVSGRARGTGWSLSLGRTLEFGICACQGSLAAETLGFVGLKPTSVMAWAGRA
jgi:hypothetical protein